MNGSVHPLLDPTSLPGVDFGGNEIQYQSGRLNIDATPLYLMGIVLASAGVLAALKFAGFKFVIGVGG